MERGGVKEPGAELKRNLIGKTDSLAAANEGGITGGSINKCRTVRERLGSTRERKPLVEGRRVGAAKEKKWGLLWTLR